MSKQEESPTEEPSEPKKLVHKIKNKIISFLFPNNLIKDSPEFKGALTYTPHNSAENHLLTPKGDFVSKFEQFTQKIVEDVMISRSDIICVKSDVTLAELSKLIIEHAHTRTLVYKENLDHIIGFIHIKDLFECIAEGHNFNLKKLLRKPIISPQSMKLIDLLAQMQSTRTHIAVIVDEYGGTDGIVTIEDIIEEIVGRIDDEHDDFHPDEDYKILSNGNIIANARVEVEELEDILKFKLKGENDEFETIGGLVMAKVGSVPKKGQIIKINDEVTIEILDSTPRTIKQLKISCKSK